MKELSIEEKAQRYDEAINAIKELKEKHPTALVIKDWIKENFPELAESEDERIRKRIIQALHGDVLDMEEISKCTVWLEKQGEHANFRNKIQVGDKVTRNQDGMLVNLSQLKRVAKKDEKQGEKKPADKVEPKFKVGDVMRTLQEAANEMAGGMPVIISIDKEYYHCTNELIAIKDQDEYEYPPINRKHDVCDSCNEQKPAWSEEDENLFRCAIDAVREESKVRTDGCLDEEVGGMVIDWLKSLKDRVQPKQEWGEENEKMFKHIIAKATLHFSSINYLDEEEINFLKSLRPQNTWKPSGEQMKQLGKYCPDNTALTALYEYLKQL